MAALPAVARAQRPAPLNRHRALAGSAATDGEDAIRVHGALLSRGEGTETSARTARITSKAVTSDPSQSSTKPRTLDGPAPASHVWHVGQGFSVGRPVDWIEPPFRTDEAVRRLDSVLGALENRGLRWENTRFARYRNRLAQIVHVPLSSLSRNDQLAYFEAAHQAYTLFDSMQWWATVSQAELEQRLRHVLKGGDQPNHIGKDGRPKADHSRNIFFELALATRLHERGFALELTEPDLRATRPDIALPLAVACKRPSSANGALEDCCADARRQLAGLQGVIGVIALDVARLTGLHLSNERAVSSDVDADEDIRERILWVSGKLRKLVTPGRMKLFPEAAAVFLFCAAPFWLKPPQVVYLPNVLSVGTTLPYGDPRLAPLERDLNRAFEGNEPVWQLLVR